MGVLLVVAAAVISIEYSRLGPSAPAPRPDDPPQDTELFYVRDAQHSHVLVAYDWTGRRRGSITLPSWVDASRVREASDGGAFMLDPTSSDYYAAYFDRLGHTVQEVEEPNFASQVWASDNRYACVIAASAGPVLITRLPGQPDRTVPIQESNQVTIAACNPDRDVAILVAGSRVTVVKLSRGAVLAERDLGFNVSPVASRDAAFVAAGSGIYRATDLGTPVAEIDSSGTAFAFSGDGSLLLAGTGAWLELIDWRKAASVWRQDLLGANITAWIARPSGREFAIGLESRSVMVVHRDGKTTTFAFGELVGH